jgi:nickel-dependent lactate racemase
MNIEILCGEQHVDIEMPDDTVVLKPNASESLPDPEGAVANAIAQPIGTAPLAELAAGRTDACIVISDITRPVPNRQVLPPILQTLEAAGIARDAITILIATGMHRPNEGQELASMVGVEIMEKYRIINHFCRKQKDLRHIADIDGAPIELNQHYLDADLKILTGLIEPHMYAGYSGGRKSLLPGISSYQTMTHMHSFKMIDHPNVTNCCLDGNPFHEAGRRVCELAGVDFIVNVIINKSRQMAGVFAGHYDVAHRAGCDQVADMAVQCMADKVDLVVTSAGGYPLDATFYQVSKGLIAARNILKKGGIIIIACECREGMGSTEYCKLIAEGNTPEEFFNIRSNPENFVIDQWCLQTTYQAVGHASRVYVYSPYLVKEDLARLGMTKIDDIQATLNSLLPNRPWVAVSPEGPYVVGLVDQHR